MKTQNLSYIYRYFSPESIHRQHVQSPSLDMSSDVYRFQQQDSNVQRRPKNIAKVEPYSMNNNTTRPLSQARIELNSMGNTPTNSSTSSSSAVSLGGMIRHSDFLLPISKSSSSYIPPPIPFSQSFVDDSLHQYPSYNEQRKDLPLPISHSQDKYQSSLPKDLHASMVRIIIYEKPIIVFAFHLIKTSSI